MKAREAFLDFLSRRGGILEGKVVTAAFSGGADSLCLLSLLSEFLPRERIRAVYVNHNIRSEAEIGREIALNRENACALGLELEVREIPRGAVGEYALAHSTTTEAAARALRYDLLSDSEILATAHTASDQAELVAMRLITGSSLPALAGVREARGNVVRPLLGAFRKDIEEHVAKLGLEPSRDSTNDELFCLRNKVRHLVMDSFTEEQVRLFLDISRNLQEAEARDGRAHLTASADSFVLKRGEYLSYRAIGRVSTLYGAWGMLSPGRADSAWLDAAGKVIRDGGTSSSSVGVVAANGGEVWFMPPERNFALEYKLGASLPNGLFFEETDDSEALRIPAGFKGFARMAEEGDRMLLRGGWKSVMSLLPLKRGVVLQDGQGVAAVFASPWKGRDRVAARLLSDDWRALPGVRLSPKRP